MPETPDPLSIAIAQHQAGRLPEAEQLYRQILTVDPNNADAWNLLGVLKSQVGQHEVAVQHIQRATQLDPTFAQAFNNLGTLEKTITFGVTTVELQFNNQSNAGIGGTVTLTTGTLRLPFHGPAPRAGRK